MRANKLKTAVHSMPFYSGPPDFFLCRCTCRCFSAEDDSFHGFQFPGAVVTPKFHMVEKQVVPFLQRWRLGLEFMGEQGESIHSQFNNLETIYGNILNMVDKKHRIVQEHYLHVQPSNIAQQP